MGWTSCAREETPSLESPLAFVLNIDDSDSYLFLFIYFFFTIFGVPFWSYQFL